jgi:protein tyrosine/serine phosphatase
VLLFTTGGSIVSEYPDLEAGTKITIAMETPGGYLKEYNALHLDQYSVKRKDFPQLDWKQYANFRMVATSGIREGVLYRSSSPVNPKYNRNIYADEAIRSTRVKTVINMSDTTSDLDGFVGYDDSYYKTVNHVELGMESNYGDEDFNKKLAEGVRFMIAHPSPYMIHCIEGKERVGFMLAILESLMGASYTEVRQDFLISHYNYYGIKPDSERARVIADGTLREQLKYVFGKDPAKADLAKEANNYLRKTGLSASEITRLKTCLARYKNTMSVTKSVRTVKAARLKKSAVTVKPLQVKLPKGKVTYKKLSGSKYLTLNKSTGKITVKKKTRKGTYKIKVRVTAAGNGLYQKMDKDITVVVKVRKK